MSSITNSRVSEAEFLSLPESVERIELIDGEVIVSPSPLFWHQEVLGRLVFALRRWSEGRSGVTVAQAPLDVRFAPGRILQPDAMVFLATIDREEPGPITRVPEICVEVLSVNRAYDRVTKRFVYGSAGVVEYWIVDPILETFEFLESTPLGFRVRLPEGAVYRSAAIPGLELDLEAFWRALPD